ncbi:hypothetical protein M2305_000205 [Gluconobacter cerinus]|nr:hypothetical protein [Gluconobacter cerinus]
MKDQITEVRCRVCIAGHGLCPLFREEQPPLFLCLAASSGVATTRATGGEEDHPCLHGAQRRKTGKPLWAASAC